MALPDIKDAGIVTDFVRWGWPWHGLCQGGTIGTSGQTIAQPYSGHAWLIDKGLPMPDMTPGEIAAEAAAGREWRNYALISGGQVYGTWLPRRIVFGHLQPASFIHVDADGINWLVALDDAGFPAADTVRCNFTVIRFGEFVISGDLPAPITRTIDVSCESTGLDTEARSVTLFDVWTNGSAVAFGVMREITGSAGGTDCISVIELHITGSGGADGSGLAFGLAESIPRSSLEVLIGDNGTSGSILSGVMVEGPETKRDGDGCLIWSDTPSTFEIGWLGELSGGGQPLVDGYHWEVTRCRFAAYDADGSLRAWRLRYTLTIDTDVVSVDDSGRMGGPICGLIEQGEGLFHIIDVSVETTRRQGYALLRGDTVVDLIQKQDVLTGTQRYTYEAITTPGALRTISYPVPYDTTGETWDGALTTGLLPGNGVSPRDELWQAWLDPYETSASLPAPLNDGVTMFGVHRTLNCAAFYLGDPVRTYGIVGTQLGNLSTGETGPLYFSWQRKTGATAFSASPICYV